MWQYAPPPALRRISYGGAGFLGGSYGARDFQGSGIQIPFLPGSRPVYAQHVRGKRLYELKNHLGNVTTVVSDRKIPYFASGSGDLVYFSPEIASAQDYYPFGSIMPGRSLASGDYRFGFQSQEQDDEVKGVGNSVNYKYRVDDTRLGRFLSIDPLASKYPHWSPYSFSGNQVIHTSELEGLEPVKDANEYARFLDRNGGEDLSSFEGESSPQRQVTGSSSAPGVATPTPGSPGVRAAPGNPTPGPGTGNRPVSPGPGSRLLAAVSPVLVAVGTAASIIYGGQLNPNPPSRFSTADDPNTAADRDQFTEEDDNPDWVYRVIRPEEVGAQVSGLMAKAPFDTRYSIEDHVVNGQRINTRFISTSRTYAAALHNLDRYRDGQGRKGAGIVAINLKKVLTPVYDLSTEAGRQVYLRTPVAKNFARYSQEILIESYVSPNAIIRIQ